MKFLHTADWHIGLRAAHVELAGPKVREARFTAARRAIDAAREHAVDFVVLAGDTFDANGVGRDLVQKTVDLLAAAGRPVFVIPGNHDPAGPGSVWEHGAWERAPAVRVLRDAAPVAVPGGTLFPCPIRLGQSGDPTAWIADAPGEGVRLGLAHGSLPIADAQETDWLLPADAAVRGRLDYLALGHWHGRRDADAARTVYPGTPEPTKFGEPHAGQCLIVEIAAAGAAPVITPVATAHLRWMTLARRLERAGDLARVVSEIDALPDPDRTLLDVRLEGLLAAADATPLAELADLLRGRGFLYHRLDDTRLIPSPTDAAWIDELPAGYLRDAARRLRDLAAGDPVAGHALLALYRLAREAAR